MKLKLNQEPYFIESTLGAFGVADPRGFAEGDEDASALRDKSGHLPDGLAEEEHLRGVLRGLEDGVRSLNAADEGALKEAGSGGVDEVDATEGAEDGGGTRGLHGSSKPLMTMDIWNEPPLKIILPSS